MKVCHFAATTGLGRGDAFIDLINALGNRVDVSLVAPRGALFLENISNKIEIVEYQAKNDRNNPRLYLELYRTLRKLQPDIVHTHFAKATLIFYRLNKFLKIPHVATKHNPRKGKIFEKLQHVIAVSEGVQKSLGNRSTVIYNGINPVAVEMASVNKVFTIRAIGRLDRVKGFDLLIKEVKKLDFDFVLEIVGEGQERANLEKLIQQEQLADRVFLLGYRTDIPRLINSADLQVMTSLSEGFSLAMVEAIFYGKVFISTEVAGCKEILPEGLLIKDAKIAEKISDVYLNYSKYEQDFSRLQNKFRTVLNIEHTSSKHLEYYANKTLCLPG